MNESIQNLLQYISSFTGNDIIYVSGNCLISDYLMDGTSPAEVSLYVDDPDINLCYIIDEWIEDWSCAEWHRCEVVDNVFVYSTSDMMITINRNSVDKHKYRYAYNPCIFILRPEFVLEAMCRQMLTLTSSDDYFIQLYRIINTQELEMQYLYKVQNIMIDFREKLLAAISPVAWDRLTIRAQSCGTLVEDALTAFFEVFNINTTCTYTKWQPLNSMWVK